MRDAIKKAGKAAKADKDCQCYYTGFHPLFGERGGKKKAADLNREVNPTYKRTKPKTSKKSPDGQSK